MLPASPPQHNLPGACGSRPQPLSQTTATVSISRSRHRWIWRAIVDRGGAAGQILILAMYVGPWCRVTHSAATMVCWEDAKAVFVAIDEHETGWMAQADLGAALQRYWPAASSRQLPPAAAAPRSRCRSSLVLAGAGCTVLAWTAARPRSRRASQSWRPRKRRLGSCRWTSSASCAATGTPRVPATQAKLLEPTLPEPTLPERPPAQRSPPPERLSYWLR